jgi:hypothetical protein
MNRALTLTVIVLMVVVVPAGADRADYAPCAVLPPSFSWRNVNGTDYTTPIKNQAPAPTCEAYALCAALETLMQYQTGALFDPDLSDCHLYFYAGGTYEAGYVNLVDAADYLVEQGVPDEGCYPDPHRPFDYPFESLSGWENRTTKITGWGWVEHTEEAIKNALIHYGPLVLCAYFWQDFYYYNGGVYEHRWGPLAGGHVMIIVGYDDAERYWLVKNSWGTDWGEDGWLKLSYDLDAIAEWYGEGTGVMYVDGVYGNFMPDVPRVYFERPEIYRTYLLGAELPTLFRNLPFVQEAAPRIVGDCTAVARAENAQQVAFYLDDVLVAVDEEAPYTWNLSAPFGIHTLTVVARNEEGAISQDVRDVFVIV